MFIKVLCKDIQYIFFFKTETSLSRGGAKNDMFCKLKTESNMLLLLLHCSSSLTNDHVGVIVIDLSSST